MNSLAIDDDLSSSSSEASSSSESENESESSHHSNASFQNGTRKSAIPIRKDGMAVCERCGNVGVKHAFYSKTKRFCSLACSRGIPKTSGGKTSSAQLKTTKRPFGLKISPQQKRAKPGGVERVDLTGTFNWKSYVERPHFTAAAVSCFKHASLSDCWDNITAGMKIEVENKDCDNFGSIFPNFYWIATVIKIAGYMVKLRYEGFGTDSSKDFWINLGVHSVHPVGWCASQGKPLIPPKTIEQKYIDWKEFLVKRLTGARTLPSNFHAKVQDALKSRFKIGMKLEVVDKNRISCVRVATVKEVVGGRLHVSYETAKDWDEGFWCHERSPLIHPVGWAQIVGHDLRASLDYAKKSLQKTLLKKFEHDDATWDMFLLVRNPLCELKFKEGMKLEAIDPLNLSTICVATVTRVLRNNYLMIGIDGMMAANGSDWFCYHASSPHIYPVGFCELNNIDLTPPRGHEGEFKWFEYLKYTKSVAAPVALFKKELPNHGFKEDMHLEAVDLMEPRLICVGKVARVVGRLLRVHFDGWDVTYDQWCDCESPDLFPVGWCHLVGYRLEPPRIEGVDALKKKKKYQMYKGPRRKKKFRGLHKKHGFNSKHVSSQLTMDVLHGKQKVEDFVVDSALVSSSSIFSVSDFGKDRETTLDEHNHFRFSQSLPSKPVSAGSKMSSGGISLSTSHTELNPEQWSVLDVAQFLRINECGAYCQIFCQQGINGEKFVSMSKEDLMSLTGMKVGPSLKINDLIQQLKSKKRLNFF